MVTVNLNAGALAAVVDEIERRNPPVTGTIPPDLNGTLVRNGPNPLRGRFEGNDVLSWRPEAAMLHGLSFCDGQVTGYRNRWARTQQWARVHDPDNAQSLLDTDPNISVVQHAGEIMMLAEGEDKDCYNPGCDGGPNLLMLSQPNGKLKDVSTTHLPGNVPKFNHAVTSIGDLNGDGLLEIAIPRLGNPSQPADGVAVYLNKGGGNFAVAPVGAMPDEIRYMPYTE